MKPKSEQKFKEYVHELAENDHTKADNVPIDEDWYSVYFDEKFLFGVDRNGI